MSGPAPIHRPRGPLEHRASRHPTNDVHIRLRWSSGPRPTHDAPCRNSHRPVLQHFDVLQHLHAPRQVPAFRGSEEVVQPFQGHEEPLDHHDDKGHHGQRLLDGGEQGQHLEALRAQLVSMNFPVCRCGMSASPPLFPVLWTPPLPPPPSPPPPPPSTTIPSPTTPSTPISSSTTPLHAPSPSTTPHPYPLHHLLHPPSPPRPPRKLTLADPPPLFPACREIPSNQPGS